MNERRKTESMDQETNQILFGQGLSPGLAVGKIWLYEGRLPDESRDQAIHESEVQRQQTRIDRAVTQVGLDLAGAAEQAEHELNKELAAIFRAHRGILESAPLLKELREAIQRELIHAEEAVQRVFWRWEHRFASESNEVLAHIGDDMADLGKRLRHRLAGIHAHPLSSVPEGSVVVAPRLLPSETIHLTPGKIAAVLVVHGSPGSHAALIATARGIPAVGQLPNILSHVSPGDTILVDAFSGKIVLRPDEESRTRFEQRVGQQRASLAERRTRRLGPVRTRDGIEIQIAANVGSREEAELAAESGAVGIGLLRLEFLLMSDRELPSEAELVSRLDSALAPFAGRPVTVRLLDAGGDKPVPWLDLPPEGCPFLGRRGIRLLLEYPELLDHQLRAFLRLVQRGYDLRILVPMVTLKEELWKVRQHLTRAASALGLQTVPPLGAMIETPAAALCVEALKAEADFLSLGTNDLTQYTMAADRENAAAAHYFRDNHPAVLRLVRMVCEEAGDTPVWVCGELGGRPEAVPTLLRLGVRNLSVAPPLLPGVREAVRDVDLSAVAHPAAGLSSPGSDHEGAEPPGQERQPAPQDGLGELRDSVGPASW